MPFRDDFDGPSIDLGVWVPYYLPHWSSRAASAATYELEASELRLTIPVDQRRWCADDHEPQLRVSGIQSGLYAGQQPFRDGQAVRQSQTTHWGWLAEGGRIEVRARMELSPRSMASVWLVGREMVPEECGEICVFEVFGEAPRAVGMGIKNFRDPALSWDFEAPELDVDIAEPHVYAIDWQPGRVDWFLDGEHVRSVDQAPAYPLQAMVAVFDFPEKPGPDDHVPVFAVDWIGG